MTARQSNKVVVLRTIFEYRETRFRNLPQHRCSMRFGHIPVMTLEVKLKKVVEKFRKHQKILSKIFSEHNNSTNLNHYLFYVYDLIGIVFSIKKHVFFEFSFLLIFASHAYLIVKTLFPEPQEGEINGLYIYCTFVLESVPP